MKCIYVTCVLHLYVSLTVAFIGKSLDSGYEFPKCCAGVNQVMRLENSTYNCGDSFSKFQIIDNEYFSNVSSSYCVDVFEDRFYAFGIGASGEFSKLWMLTPRMFHKCCPMGYVYNRNIHGCYEDLDTANQSRSFRFARIGLPHCQIIQDFDLHGATKDLSNLPTGDFCVDNTQDNLEVKRICINDLKVCDIRRCIHKCCQDGYSFVNGSNCAPTYLYGVDLNFTESIEQNNDFVIVHGYTGKIYLQPSAWEFHLDSKGVFRLFDEKIGNEIYGPAEETYCIEHATKNGISFGHRLFRKFSEVQMEEKYVINGYVMIISSISLLLTIIFYICTGETKKLFGKTLVSFCVCLMMTYSILIYSTLSMEDVKKNTTLCFTFGFLLLYGELSTFLWLKLLCFDIYDTFGSGKMASEYKSSKLKRFIKYSIYGWGMPLILTIIPLSLFHLEILPESIRIIMGVYRCAIDRESGNYADLLFRTAPVTIIQLINLYLFIKTVKFCIDVKSEIHKMNDNFDQTNKKFLIHKERFTLITKLTVIMGLSYIFEVVSSFYDFSQTKPTKYLEIVWDIINCLQGFFIFLIFICKRKMIDKIKSHTGMRTLRKISLSSANTLTVGLSFDKDKRNRAE